MVVSVRTAVEADIPALVEMGRALHAESPRYSKLTFNAEKVAALAARIVPGGGALVAEKNGILVGMMAGFVVAHWFSDDLIASDFVLYLVPEERRKGRAALMLVRAFEVWAVAQGATEIAPGASTGVANEATAAFYSKLGYTRLTSVSLLKRVA